MASFNLTVAVAVLCSVMVLVSQAAESRFLGKVKSADTPEPSGLSESVARELITEWGQWVVSGNYTGDQIAEKFFFPESVLRGTVSAMTRSQFGAKESSFAEATSPADLKKLTIGQYFDYFNGNNLKGMNATWNEDNDYIVRVSTDALLCNLFKKFELPGGTVVAVMSFIVKQKDGDTKILSLHSSPLFMTPPEPLNETVLDSADPMALSSSPAMQLDALTQSMAYTSGSELSEDTARLVIEKWGESVVSGSFSGAEIAQEFFFSDAVLRGTVSAITRTQSGARANTFTEATPPAKLEDLNIGQYFEYFNGANLKDMNVQWDNGNDFLVRISSDALQCNVFKKFEIGGGEVVAVMSFVVKQRPGGVKILSLHSSPLHCEPPPALYESVLWSGCEA